LNCIPGPYQSKAQQTKCIKCGVGKSSSDVGRQFDCDACTKGRYQQAQGTTKCLNCIPGTFQSIEQQTKCIVCNVGRASSKVARDTNCDNCTKGRHQPINGSTTCLNCIPGTY
jgi:hypothetical protein